ncbi:MAG: MCE family protein [Desulfobacterales bacterium]|nr:MCE family protein [Desulfobacterales bacterium]
MEPEFNTKEKILGVFIIGIVVILLSVLVLIGRGKDWFKTYINYYTIFKESYNLQENAAVKLYKADIGKVKKITLVENKVKVDLVILEEYASRIRSDTLATVESPTFIGSEYISIKPGSSDAALIPEYGEIPSMPMKTLSDVLDEFQVEKTAKMVIKAIQDFSEITNILRDPGGPLFIAIEHANKTFSHFENIMADVQAGKGTAGGLLKSDALLESLLVTIDKLKQILENIAQASVKAPETMNQVQGNLVTIKKIGDEVLTSVAGAEKIIKEIENNLDKFKVILTNIEKGSDPIPQITQSTKEGIREIRKGVENVDSVFKSLQKNIFIRSHLPAEPEGINTDAGLRP